MSEQRAWFPRSPNGWALSRYGQRNTILKPYRFHGAIHMSTSITLKNIPEPIYQRIKLAAKRHHRSMNSEIIACLEQTLAPSPVDVQARLEDARRLRERFVGPDLTLEDITSAIANDSTSPALS